MRQSSRFNPIGGIAYIIPARRSQEDTGSQVSTSEAEGYTQENHPACIRIFGSEVEAWDEKTTRKACDEQSLPWIPEVDKWEITADEVRQVV